MAFPMAPPRLCAFTVSIVSAENVWPSEASLQGSKASVSVHFPGEEAVHGVSSESSSSASPPPSPLFSDPVTPRNDSSSPQTPVENSPKKTKAKGKPDRDPNPKTKSNPSPSPNPSPNSNTSSTPNSNSDPSPSPVPNPNPSTGTPSVSFEFGALSEHVRDSAFTLWHDLVTDPLEVSLQWVSPSGKVRTVIGKVPIDLSELLFSESLVLERDFELRSVQPDTAPDQKLPTAKKDQKNASSASAPSKGKKGSNSEEIPPLLLPGAFMKVRISIDIPILPDEERQEGMILEFDDFSVKRIPQQYADMVSSDASFSMAFEMPGFSGSWWESIPDLKREVKEKIAIARVQGGVVSLKEANEGVLSSSGEDSASPSSDAKLEPTRFEAQKKADEADSVDSSVPNVPDPPSQPRTEAMITWNSRIRRFLPCEGVKELRDRIWKKHTWHGELARYSNSQPVPFQRDHLAVGIDLSPLLKEGAITAWPSSAVSLCTRKRELLSEHGEQRVCGTDDDNATASPWQSCCAQLVIRVRTSRPLEPVWVPPPKPTVKLEEILTIRPKLPPFDARLRIAVDEFRDLVRAGAISIMSLEEKVISENMSEFNSTALWSDRAEHNEKLRKKLSDELHRTGSWHYLKEEMKGRVVKIASEKFKLTNEETRDNSFVFYNSLYVQLMNVIKESTEDLDMMRKEAFLNFSEGLETGASKRLHTVEHLRQLADEYEADDDYLSANKCYEEILSENRSSPDHWFEYGLFCMRGKHKELGKAEECFRESVNIQEDYVPSLLALACLLWHRSFNSQAEVILHRIVDLHPPEEAIAWLLLGQIHLSTDDEIDSGRTEKANSCFTRAENIYSSLKDTSSTILSSTLLRHAFSLSYPIHQSGIPSNAYIDAASLLLDLHFLKEAQIVLAMEHAAFSCDIGFKLCLARAKLFLCDFNEAENLIKEITTSCEAQSVADTAWMLLGHIYYLSGSFRQAIDSYKQICRYSDGKDQSFYMFGVLELAKSYLHEHHVDKAKGIVVDLCATNPSSSSWLVAGMVFYEGGDMESAQAALEEGNVLDPWNFKIWAYLTLVSLATDRMEEAKFAFEQALDCAVFPPLLVEIADAFHAKGDSKVAEVAFQKLCEGKNGALISRLTWETGSWHQKLCLAKKIAEESQKNLEAYGVSSEYDPLQATLDTTDVQPNVPRGDDTGGSYNLCLKELQALSCT